MPTGFVPNTVEGIALLLASIFTCSEVQTESSDGPIMFRYEYKISIGFCHVVTCTVPTFIERRWYGTGTLMLPIVLFHHSRLFRGCLARASRMFGC
uniref:Secreted protein n=1 Tax=Setaria viridis TaxID=4556 RepID=A0A4U6SX76_SETVI|nr:hypothetical protein SEVIR_9G135750v2 [Setaria viridis]